MGLVQSFLEMGYEVIAIAPEDEYSKLLVKSGCQFFPLKMENKGQNPIKDVFLGRQLYKIYKKVKPDVILQFTIKPNIYGTLAASLLKIPVINNVSGLGTVFLHKNLVSKIAHLLYKVSFRHATKVFFQNKDDQQLFIKNKLVRQEVTGLLPGSGVKIEKYNPTEFKRNNPIIFLLIARLLYDKGINEYIQAIRILKNKNINAHFQLMGSLDEVSSLGIPKHQLDEWILEGLIEYIPFKKDIMEDLQNADCIVLPSYREGTPRTLLEGAAMAKPLVATDVPGCREVVEDGVNGFLCKVKDEKDLADKMLKISQLTDSELNSLGRNSRKLVLLKFDEKIVIESYIDAINRILSTVNQVKY
jgi:glycosyltransferase involved in cell wall biosynthesis